MKSVLSTNLNKIKNDNSSHSRSGFSLNNTHSASMLNTNLNNKLRLNNQQISKNSTGNFSDYLQSIKSTNSLNIP